MDDAARFGTALTRRRTLHAAGATAFATLAGCLTNDRSGSRSAVQEYSLDINRIERTPVEYALYEPDDNPLFGDPAETALANVLPDGRHTTYGYQPVPNDGYIKYKESYYQLKYVVTGRQQMERQLVRVDTVPQEQVSDDAILVETLERPSARIIKLLHSYTQSGGGSSTAELLRDDGYVLRRPSERESRLASGELDGQVITMTDSGAWAYRVDVTTEQLTETAHTAFAVEVAGSQSEFREVVFGSRIDAELDPDELTADAREILEGAIAGEPYTEEVPLTASFETLLEALGLSAVDTAANRKLLWYDDELYRYDLYINTM
ncbi:hypothetical protein [Halohasta litorea]|uniref:Uncharacterized protein n=1 Tax=Halohasta litorea TaxID=869891 RepID=A0ABD6DCR3_9EURY|nr:hypothetical protein [Halohasta litorea]